MSKNVLIFSGLDSSGQFVLWVTDGTAAGTFELPMAAGEYTGGGGFRPLNFFAFDGKVLFSGLDSYDQDGLWVTDGTQAGTYMVDDINPTGDSADISYLTTLNGLLIFSANDGVHRQQLWASNGTQQGTLMIDDINLTGSADIKYLAVVDCELYFTANDGIHGIQLWKTNGTAAGTSMVDDINKLPSGLTAAEVDAALGK